MARKVEGTARDRVKGLEQIEKEQRRKTLMLTGLISFIVLCLLGVGITIAVKSDKGSKDNTATATVDKTPTNITSEGSFQVLKSGSINTGKTPAASNGKRLQVVFDPMCPGCGAFDRATHGDLDQKVKSGAIDLRLSPVSFLDRSSTDQYSSRAASAFITVAQEDPAHAFSFMTALYDEKNQPKEATEYQPVSDEKLGEIAKSAGVKDSVANEFPKHYYVKWIQARTAAMDKRKELFPDGLSTPGVFVGGKDSADKTEGTTRVQFTTDKSMVDTLNDAINNAK